MSRRFDHKTTEFSPDGRIHQLENAMEAISKGGSGIAVLFKNGVVFAAERRITSKLIDFKTESEKMYKIDSHIACVMAGLQADANTLMDFARKEAQDYRRTYQEPIPIEQLVQRLCDLKHGYTQFGGYRPFGVSFLLGGWDDRLGFQLYETDPSGNYGGWKAAAIGAQSAAAAGIFKKHFEKEDDSAQLDEGSALMLALKAICKALDVTDPSAEKLEFAVFRKTPEKEIAWNVLSRKDTQLLVEKAKSEIDFGEED